ncbi:SymE family type I addiction module toxin [Oribacterium sp. Sow4_G1_1]|uniref:SymE family type I addiction module toxin n=1 Tax=Oribacterium sp. Sow4_G1_1 TaxID=3438794 RepID=UPI003F9A8B68
MKEERTLTVGTRTRVHYRGWQTSYHEYPQISLTGKWLSELGIHAGDKVEVECRDGQITITKA